MAYLTGFPQVCPFSQAKMLNLPQKAKVKTPPFCSSCLKPKQGIPRFFWPEPVSCFICSGCGRQASFFLENSVKNKTTFNIYLI